MPQLQVADLKPNEEYEKERPQRRKTAMALKDKRRLHVGPIVTLLFENHETLVYQIQEIMRSEKLTKPEELEGEVRVYTELMPAKGELSACLFIEVNVSDAIKPTMDTMVGLDDEGKVAIVFGGERIPAVFEGGRSKEGRISAVQYIRFPFTDAQVNALAEASDVRVEINHETYQHTQAVPEVMKLEWLKDLMGK